MARDRRRGSSHLYYWIWVASQDCSEVITDRKRDLLVLRDEPGVHVGLSSIPISQKPADMATDIPGIIALKGR